MSDRVKEIKVRQEFWIKYGMSPQDLEWWENTHYLLARLEKAEKLIKKYESTYSQREKIGADMSMSEKLFLVEARAYFEDRKE